MTEPTKTLVLMVGLPRSGKSSWARRQGFPICNPDAIRLALHGKRFESLAEGFVWAIAKVMVRALFLAGHDTVILDATNVTKRRRAEWLSKGWTCRYMEISAPPEVCVERAKHTGQEDLVPVIAKMHAEYQPLEPHEVRWDGAPLGYVAGDGGFVRACVP